MEVGGVYLSSGYGGAGGGGWYGGSGTVPDGSGDDDRGGGGGSGFVWTSSTASSVPSGYSVSSSYYLTDATTYAGNTSFTSTSGSTETGHSGDGYARITLVSGTKKTEITETANRWNNIEDQKASGTFTGSFNYNGKIITETDTKGNKITHKEHIGLNYVEYIESTGTQYIDTGIIPNQDTRLEMTAETTTDVADAGNGSGFIPYGAGSSYNSNAFECYTQSSQYEFNYDGQYDFIGTAKAGEKISISHNKNVVNIAIGSTQYSKNFTYNTFTTPYTMTLFGINRGNIISGKARIYSCQIFDNETLVRDFIPALDTSNVPCLYDRVTNQYFYNSGTGNFNYQ